MNNFLVFLAVLVIAAFSALFAVPHFVDWNRYRGVFEEEASRFLGRDVRVGGNVGLRLLPTPSFRLEKIVVADHEAGSGEAFFRAEAISARLSVAPLLRGVLEANEIELVAPQLHIVPERKAAATQRPAGRAADRLPFMPRDLALSSVRIRDGVLIVDGADRNERLRLTALEGELSAPALQGPYRFRGTFGDAAARRDLRLTTTEADADGSVRFKLALKQLDTGISATIDARASDLQGAMRTEGEFTALIPVSALTGATPKAEAATDKSKDAVKDATEIEVKAALATDTERLKLSNLSVSIEQQGRPQMLAGELEYALGTQKLHVALNSRWLDLDQLMTTLGRPSGEKSPLVDLVQALARAGSLASDRGTSNVSLAVDQATLGQEQVSGIALKLASTRAATSVDELRIGLPGASRADFSGRITGTAAAARYDGDLVVRGGSLARALTWATAGGFKLDPARDAPYAVRARLDATATSVRAYDMTAEIAGTIGQGEVELGLKERKTLAVTIEGEQVDLRPVLPAVTADGASRRNPILVALAAASAAGIKIDSVDSRLRLKAARVIMPDGVFADVAADLEWQDRKLRIAGLKFDAGDGVALDIEGDLTGLADPADSPRGTLRGVVSADSPRGVSTLAGLAAWPAAMLPAETAARAIVPLRLAGTVVLGEAGAVDLTADGTAAATNTKVRARFDRGLTQWKSSGLDLSLILDGPEAERIVRALAETAGAESHPRTAAGSRVVFRTSGTLAGTTTATDGLATLVRIERGPVVSSFTGRVAAVSPLAATGRLEWVTPDGAALGSMLSEIPHLNLAGVAMRGNASMRIAGPLIALERIDATVADIPVRGHLSTTGKGELGGNLDVGSVSIAALLQPFSQGQRSASAAAAVASQAAAATGASPSAWPPSTIDAAGNVGSGSLTLTARQLIAAPGLALSDARIGLDWRPGSIALNNISGQAAGGSWTASVKIEGSGASTQMWAVLRANGARLERIIATPADGKPVAEGPFNLMLKGSGKGTNLRDMMSDLTGSGSLELGNAKVAALTPAAVHAALDDGFKGPAEVLIQGVRDRVLASMQKPAQVTDLQARSLNLEIANGIVVANSRPLALPQGQVQVGLKVDLSALAMSGEWRIERLAPLANAPTGKGPLPPLPPVTVGINGPLAALGRVPAALNTEALEREITVRKIERDLEELERLRKLDEDRAKEEALRRGQSETTPPALNTAAPVTNATPPQSPPVPPPAAAAAGLPTQETPTTPTSPQAAEPAPRARPTPAPAPKPVYRPFNAEEQKKIFGGG